MSATSPLANVPARAPRRLRPLPATLLAGVILIVSTATPLRAAEPDSTEAPGDSITAREPQRAPIDTPRAADEARGPYRADRIAALGFDNVTVGPSGTDVAYENRRFRHSAFARGRLVGAFVPGPESAAPPATLFERRLGMVVGAVLDMSASAGVPDAVRYPSDRDFPTPPTGPTLSSVRWATDVDFVPLFSYELGRIFDPVQIRIELEPRVRVNPWPGARATASLVIPIRNDFEVDSIHPDINRVRPGPVTLEQFAWLRGVALVSGTAGLFADNRYGVSLGAARPLMGGAFLLDTQADLTGYIAFPSTGTEYSGVELFTGFAGVTWHPPKLDLGVRLRAERFIYGDQGAELELRRAMGDLDVAFFFQRTSGFNVQGVRLLIPVPPAVRRHATPHTAGLPVRFLPVDRLPLNYRDEAAPVGRALRNVASREEFLRQLNQPDLATNADRYRAGRGWASPPRPGGSPQVSLTGMTGFINTPWCGVMTDRGVEMGYNSIPKGAAYDHPGQYRNDVYYAALGFLPRLEVGLRWTVIPGLKAFSTIVPDSKLTDSDRMLSGRIELIPARPWRPGLAAGVEDAVGTRRFHATYLVSGIPFAYQRLQARLAVGYAPYVVTASRRTLDGAFGAVEASVWRPVAASLEYDTEKWNTSLGIDLGFGFRARVALLGGKYTSVGAGWFVAL